MTLASNKWPFNSKLALCLLLSTERTLVNEKLVNAKEAWGFFPQETHLIQGHLSPLKVQTAATQTAEQARCLRKASLFPGIQKVEGGLAARGISTQEEQSLVTKGSSQSVSKNSFSWPLPRAPQWPARALTVTCGIWCQPALEPPILSPHSHTVFSSHLTLFF